MPLIEKRKLIEMLSPPLDAFLCAQLIDEFVSAEKRYIQRDWEPAELDGGQFCEIAARIYYHADSGNINHSKDIDGCVKYINNDQVSHGINPRHDAIHVCKVIGTVYKFRSQRGAVHISPSYKPNHMDSKFIIESVRWVMNETLRIFWSGDREGAAKAIRELLQFDVPCIGQFEDAIIVQRTDLNTDEEILLLLHYAGEDGFSRNQIGKYAMRAASSVTTSLKKLSSPSVRQILKMSNGNYRLTDIGSKRIREELSAKLLL